MGRVLVAERRGGRWHVTARGVDHEEIFLDDEDFEKYIRLLGEVVNECGWILFAFCLMPNHVHLFFETPEPNRAQGMHLLQLRYATYFKQKYGRDGHLFGARYHPTPVDEALHFINVACYIAANPAKARLCKRPEDWDWSSLGLVSRGIKLTWLAHDELCAQLFALTGRTFFEEWIG